MSQCKRFLKWTANRRIHRVIVVGLLFAAAGCGRSNGDGQKADSAAAATTQPDVKPILAATSPDASQPSAQSSLQSSSNSDDSDWQHALTTNRLDAYLAYLKQHPESERLVVRSFAVSGSFAFLTASIDRFAPEDRNDVPAIGQAGMETFPGTTQWMIHTDAAGAGSGVKRGLGIGIEIPDLPLPGGRSAYLLTPQQAKQFGLVGSLGDTMLAGLDVTGSNIEVVYKENGDHYKIVSVKVSPPGAINGPPERLGTTRVSDGR